MRNRVLLAALLLVALFITCQAYQVVPRKQRVYMFGVASSFADSVTYITDLQAVDGYVMPNGFLISRSLYSLQLNNFLLTNMKRENMTCVVFFSTKKAKAEKKYQKVRKKNREKRASQFQRIGSDLFRFEEEEWINENMTEVAPEKSAPIPPKR